MRTNCLGLSLLLLADDLAEHVHCSMGMETAVKCRCFDPIYFLDWKQDPSFRRL
jgi:hypothetical protein